MIDLRWLKIRRPQVFSRFFWLRHHGVFIVQIWHKNPPTIIIGHHWSREMLQPRFLRGKNQRMTNTVDGSEILHQLRLVVYPCTQFYTSRCCRTSSINSRSNVLKSVVKKEYYIKKQTWWDGRKVNHWITSFCRWLISCWNNAAVLHGAQKKRLKLQIRHNPSKNSIPLFLNEWLFQYIGLDSF